MATLMGSMKELKYIDRIQKGGSLLSLPQSLSQILTMMTADDFSMEDLSNVIMKDPGLTSRVLRMANSAFYRQRAEISTVNQAVMMLGVMQVKCLALSASIFQTDLLQTRYQIDVKEMFSHFISVAIGCRMLAEAVDFKAAEEAFVAGLLHDIGLVYFIHHYPDDYRTVIDRVGGYSNLVEAEQDILGIDHAAIGEMLARKWNFPENLCAAIGDHHRVPDEIEDHTILHFVQLSELINKPVIDSRLKNIEQRLAHINHLGGQLQLDRRKIDEIAFSLLAETITTAKYLGIDIGDPVEVVTRANKELLDSYLTIENLFRERQELSRRILAEERRAAMMETKNIALATLSHYINNAAMAISGRGQMVTMFVDRGEIVDENRRLETVVAVIEKSVNKIMAVLQEMRELTNLEEIEKYSDSQAINIDDRVKDRLRRMESTETEVLTGPISDNT